MKNKLKRGFTLVELMIVVAIVGVLAALAIYGVRKYIANSKTAEARTALGQIGKDVKSAYAREQMSGDVLEPGKTAAISNQLCPEAAAIPEDVPAAEKVQSDPADWDDGAGWQCLRFSMTDPQYYQYDYTPTGTGEAGDSFEAVAKGDLDGDGTFSTFTLNGKIDDSRNLLVAPTLAEENPEE